MSPQLFDPGRPMKRAKWVLGLGLGSFGLGLLTLISLPLLAGLGLFASAHADSSASGFVVVGAAGTLAFGAIFMIGAGLCSSVIGGALMVYLRVGNAISRPKQPVQTVPRLTPDNSQQPPRS
jgi:hypothetical protein